MISKDFQDELEYNVTGTCIIESPKRAIDQL